MSKIRVYATYKKFFAFMLVVVNMLLIFLFFLNPVSEEWTGMAAVFWFAPFNLICAAGIFYRKLLFTIYSHGILIKKEELYFGDDISEIDVGSKYRNLSFREKIPNPFANHSARKNYRLFMYLSDAHAKGNIIPTRKINLNFAEMSPAAIESILRFTTQGTNTIMHDKEDVS